MIEKNKPIGVFDSGVGGLSVLKQLQTDYPVETFIYLGDTARLPYGTKSPSTIISYAERNLNFLLKNYNIKALVVACNSVSTVLDFVKSPVPLFGVIKPGASAAVERLKTVDGKRIGLWATQATVLSKAYEKEIKDLDSSIDVEMISCPTLVALVEESLNAHKLLPYAFDYYLEQFENKIDVLILGCTHFPFFKVPLSKKIPEIQLIDSSISISKSLSNKLNLNANNKLELNVNKGLTDKSLTKVLITDEAKNFRSFIFQIFKKDIEIEKVEI
jgi:glutamate racemase